MSTPAAAPANQHALDQVSTMLNPILVPLGFAPGSGGSNRDGGQVLFCRGDRSGGCADLIVGLDAHADWRINDVRYCGYPKRSFSPNHDGITLSEQLENLARSLPTALASLT